MTHAIEFGGGSLAHWLRRVLTHAPLTRNTEAYEAILQQQQVVNDMRLRIAHLTFVLSTCIKKRVETHATWQEAEKAVGAAWQMFAAAESEYNTAFTVLHKMKSESGWGTPVVE